MKWDDVLKVFTNSDVGVRRSHNQDYFGVVEAPTEEVFEKRGHLFIVADGMGGHAVGELASKIAVDTIRLAFTKSTTGKPSRTMRRAILEANHAIHEKAKQNPDFKGMGTTATALALLPEGGHIAHVGDSRCYRIRGSKMEQLTFDHSLQWMTAREKGCKPEDLAMPSNVIMNSLGPKARIDVDVTGPYEIRPGDRFLLCSDGLSGPVNNHEMWAIVNALKGDEAVQLLIDMANLRGGPDNITAILVQVDLPKKSEGEVVEDDRPAPKSFFARLARNIPFPWWMMILALVALAATVLLFRMGFETKYFLSSAGLFVAFLGTGLWAFDNRRHQQQIKANAEKRIQFNRKEPETYEPAEYKIDETFVKKMASSANQLMELAQKQQWKHNSEKAAKLLEIGQKSMDEKKYKEAFRAYGRCISDLSVGRRDNTKKQEIFRPKF